MSQSSHLVVFLVELFGAKVAYFVPNSNGRWSKLSRRSPYQVCGSTVQFPLCSNSPSAPSASQKKLRRPNESSKEPNPLRTLAFSMNKSIRFHPLRSLVSHLGRRSSKGRSLGKEAAVGVGRQYPLSHAYVCVPLLSLLPTSV